MSRTAVVVAHPDDETLWATGMIAAGVDVICCTVPRKDPPRAIEFFEAVRTLGGFPILIPFIEPLYDEDIEHLDMLDLRRYETVITHNQRGEYGHRHHMNVHEHVLQSNVPNVWTFGYGKGTRVREGLRGRKLAALRAYEGQSPADTEPKWRALLNRYPIDLDVEYYNVER